MCSLDFWLNETLKNSFSKSVQWGETRWESLRIPCTDMALAALGGIMGSARRSWELVPLKSRAHTRETVIDEGLQD